MIGVLDRQRSVGSAQSMPAQINDAVSANVQQAVRPTRDPAPAPGGRMRGRSRRSSTGSAKQRLVEGELSKRDDGESSARS